METLKRNFYDLESDVNTCNRTRVLLFVVLGVFTAVMGISCCSLFTV